MLVFAAFVKLLFTSSLLSLGFLTSGSRLKQQKAVKLKKGQTTRDSPPLVPRRSDSSGSSCSGPQRRDSPAGAVSQARGQTYGLQGIGRAMASADEAAMAAVEEAALDKQTLYEESLWQSGPTTNTAKFNTRAVPKRSFPQKKVQRPATNSKELAGTFRSMDTNGDSEPNLQELQHDMEELVIKLADKNCDGEIDADEFAAAVEAKAAMFSKRSGEHPAEIVQQRVIDQELFKQEAVQMIDLLILRDMEEYMTRDAEFAMFMQKVWREGIQNNPASDICVALYLHCGTHENMSRGFHEQCILDNLQPCFGQNDEQTLEVRKDLLQMFIRRVFVQLERQAQAHLDTRKREE